MKKIALLFLLFCLSVAGYAQPKIGLRFAPNISINSVQGEGIFSNTVRNHATMRFSAGPIADFFFHDNYAFSTGLWYTVKSSAIKGNISTAGSTTAPASSFYNLQYLQVPITVKLYTNEVATDLRVYFQLGGTLDFKIAEKAKDRENNFIYREAEASDRVAYKPFDIGLLLGAGAELFMGQHTALFGGIGYNRGLVNSLGRVEYQGSKINNDLKLTNNVIYIEVGLKF